MANCMYWGWCKHGILPSVFYKLSKEELAVIASLCQIEIKNNSK